MTDHDEAMARLLKEIAELRAELAMIKLMPVPQPPPLYPRPTLKKAIPGYTPNKTFYPPNQWHC
jgi:hypothetical protein